MTTTTEARPGLIDAVATAVAAVAVTGMIHVLSSEVTGRKILMFALAAVLVAAVMFVALRSLRIFIAVLVGAATVYASRSFLSSGFINVLDLGFLLAEDVLPPVAATWIATFVMMCAVMLALGARRKIWLIALLAVITLVTIPTRFPDLA